MQLPINWEAFSAFLHVQVPHNGGHLQKILLKTLLAVTIMILLLLKLTVAKNVVILKLGLYFRGCMLRSFKMFLDTVGVSNWKRR